MEAQVTIPAVATRGSTGLRLSDFFSFQCQTYLSFSSVGPFDQINLSTSALERFSNEETHCKLANSAILRFSLIKLFISLGENLIFISTVLGGFFCNFSKYDFMLFHNGIACHAALHG